MIQTANINVVWATLLMEKLARCGLSRVVLSPGSRNTPLVAAAAAKTALTITMHFDERAAAFYALGLARALGQPVALACTSGSAVANYLPAVVEAAMDGVPLLLLTADRPPELHDCGANQTIPQSGIFGRFARFQVDLPCPDPAIPAREYLSHLDRAIPYLFGRHAGPVHINCPFREPLAPDSDGADYRDYLRDTGTTSASSSIPIEPDTPLPADLVQQVTAAERGVIVAGKMDSRDGAIAVVALADQLGWPIFPDIQSGLRIGHHHDLVISHIDHVLLSKTAASGLQPDLVLHFGGRVLSKRLLQWLSELPQIEYAQITPSALPFDPAHRITHTLIADIPSACRQLTQNHPRPPDIAWSGRWRDLDDTVTQSLKESLGNYRSTPTDPAIAYRMVNHLTLQDNPPAIWAASSLPIRLLDMYAPGIGSPVPVLANRGASGIDGTIASAAGFADAARRPIVLLIGDLAFLHDLTSLELVRRSPVPITIVLLNNNGGNIFGLLPIAAHRSLFENYFLTPHGHTFESAVHQFGLKYYRCDSMDDFDQVVSTQLPAQQSSIIEVVLPSGSGTNQMRRLADEIRRALDTQDQ